MSIVSLLDMPVDGAKSLWKLVRGIGRAQTGEAEMWLLENKDGEPTNTHWSCPQRNIKKCSLLIIHHR